MSRDEYFATEVFTPSQPAEVTFIERKTIQDRIVNDLSTPGKQLVIYGHSGSGKTTLIVNKLRQLYEDHITTRCLIEMTFEQILLDAFDRLGAFYIDESSNTKTVHLGVSFKSKYLNIRSQIQNSDHVTKYRVIPPQLTPQTLAELMGEAQCCWVLDDFHKVDESEKKKLAQTMKVFMDVSQDYKQLKIIAIGAVNTAREVLMYDSEMKSRVSEVLVPLMTESELESIINKGSRCMNIDIPLYQKDKIIKYSSGLAATCHQLCLNICFASDVMNTALETYHVSDGDVKRAVQNYINESSDTLKSVFDKAFRIQRKRKYDNCRLIAFALCRFDTDGATYPDLLQRIREKHPSYPRSNLTRYLGELKNSSRGKLIRHDLNSGKYAFSDPIFRAYAITIAQQSLEKDEFRQLSLAFDDFFLEFRKSLEKIPVLASGGKITVKIGHNDND